MDINIFAQQLISSIKHMNVGSNIRLINTHKNNIDCVEVVFDLVIMEYPQYPTKPIKKVEPLKIEIIDNENYPTVYCRKDFPLVPHLNYENNGDKHLCLFDVPYQDMQHTFNAHMLINRIHNWFTNTLRDKLHQSDQALEPFFPYVENMVYYSLNSISENFVRFELLKTEKGIFLQNVGIDSSSGEIYIILHVSIQKNQIKNIIEKIPDNLFELLELFDSDLIRGIENQILRVWSIKRNEEAYKMLFNQELNKLQQCKTCLLISIPQSRQADNAPEVYTYKLFQFVCTFKSVYKAFGFSLNGKQLILKNLNKKLDTIEIIPFNVGLLYNLETAEKYNGFEKNDLNYFQIGVGALGSQIANNFIRSGYGNWTYLDNDIFLPHNIARHCLSSNDVGINKISGMQKFVESIYSNDNISTKYTFVNQNIFENKDETIIAIKNSDVVVDCSASIAVEKCISNELSKKTRCISLFMNPKGTSLVMLCEDTDRMQTLDLLEMQYYKCLINNENLNNHLETNSKTTYTCTCRDITTSISQFNVSTFAGLSCSAIHETETNKSSSIRIWTNSNSSIDNFFETGETFIKYSYKDWDIYLINSLKDKLFCDRKENLPNETGGVLIGNFDYKYNKCYIVDHIPAPDDSIKTPMSFIRGCRDLRKKIETIENVTLNNLTYLGEWHSHPSNCTAQSSDDKTLMETIKQDNQPYSKPACMIIVGENNLSLYID